jgi:hypothetical protein
VRPLGEHCFGEFGCLHLGGQSGHSEKLVIWVGEHLVLSVYIFSHLLISSMTSLSGNSILLLWKVHFRAFRPH